MNKTYFTTVNNVAGPQLVSAIGLNGSGIGDVKAGDRIINAFKTLTLGDTPPVDQTPWRDNSNHFSTVVPEDGLFLYNGSSLEPGVYMIVVEKDYK